MRLTHFIAQMPKVELHVHLEGSIRPETLLKLAARNHVDLPANTVDGLREWYRFVDFPHFVEIYVAITRCIKTVDDIELIAREFLAGQAEQNIRHSEVTYTAQTLHMLHGIAFEKQIAALDRARAWAKSELGVSMALIVDIAREVSPQHGLQVAEWVVGAYCDDGETGVNALGLGGYEVGHPPEKHAAAFERARNAGVPCILHAGETSGPASIWGALRAAGTRRIGHGVRAIEDPTLRAYLKASQIPLEVCPASNLCLGVYPTLAAHSLPELIARGLYVTINSDDPPMFNATLTDNFLMCATAYSWDHGTIQTLVLNAARATLLPEPARVAMARSFKAEFARLLAS